MIYTKILSLPFKFFNSLKTNGLKLTFKKILSYKRNHIHANLLSSEYTEFSYNSEYQNNIDFSQYKSKVKPIAFYLPQFHTIPENDIWWGKGFTEWTNTRKAEPKFDGHYQPREPHLDIGYYDLTNIETLKHQAKLAKEHGVYCFCFYLYWFSGKRLLEKPLDLFLAHPEIDIKFCICWANENWTQAWDGLEKNILIKQDYLQSDPINFIEDIKPYLDDKRYMRIDNIPVVIIYNPENIPNVRNTVIEWRRHANEIGIGSIKIWIIRLFNNTAKKLRIEDVVDGEIEFPPNFNHGLEVKNIDTNNEKGSIFNYKNFASECENRLITTRKGKLPVYYTCMLAWDNSPRRTSGWASFAGFSLKSFFEWCSLLVNKALQTKDKIFFVNAWNEWAEGTYLEPDMKYGYANINTFSKAIFQLPFDDSVSDKILKDNTDNERRIIFVGHDACQNGAQLLALNIIKQLKEVFKYKVYLILKSDGDLIKEFETAAFETICLDNLKNIDLGEWLKSKNVKRAICNTVVSGDILHFLTENNIICISLIHEMENVIRQYSCETNLSFVISDAEKIIFSSDYVRKSNDKIAKIPEEKVVIHPQGIYAINPYLDDRENYRSVIRTKFNIPQNCSIVLGVGNADLRKGFDLFIQCMLLVCKTYNNVYFIWVGNTENKIYFRYENSIKKGGQSEKLILTGWEDDPMMYYAAADVFLLTSREDPFPSVVLEAMYAYLPVIAFEGGGGYTDIVNEKTGGLVRMEDVEVMAGRVLELLDDNGLCKRIGSYVHNFVSREYNFIDYVYFLLDIIGFVYKKVSVIVPNYNYGKYLRKRIDSVLFQTYPVFEIIILDDCSTDNSIQIIDEYEKQYPLRIKSVRNKENGGSVFTQWARGIELASGDYIWIAEADDLSLPAFLDTVMKKMIIDESIVMGYSQSKIIDDNDKLINTDYLFYTDKIDTIWRADFIANGKDEIEKHLSIMNTILNVSAVLFKKVKLIEALKNITKYKVAGDWRLYVDLLKDGSKVAFAADSLNIHRRHTDSVTGNTNSQKHFDEVCEMQEYVYELTNNSEYFGRAKEYRKELRKYLKLR